MPCAGIPRSPKGAVREPAAIYGRGIGVGRNLWGKIWPFSQPGPASPWRTSAGLAPLLF